MAASSSEVVCVLDVTKIAVEVLNPQSHGSGLQKYIDYEVRVNTSLPQFGGRPTVVRRRFRDFEWLHESLDNEVYAPGSVQRPALPEKHSLGNLDTDYDDRGKVDSRRRGLQYFLHAIVSQQGYLASPSLAIFLTADEGKFATAQIDEDSYKRYLNMPIKYSMESEINKATYTLLNFTENNAIEGDDSVPIDLLCGCAGIAFITVAKGGFFFSGRAGTGLVVARLPNGTWSAPSGIGAAGAGWGFQLGAEVTDMMIILNEPEAVRAFCSSAQLSMGTELSMSFGPVGRSAETNLTAGDGGVSTVFSYAHSRGLFVGVSLQAACIVARPDVNRTFYGRDIAPEDLLSGKVPPPRKAEPLYRALRKCESRANVATSMFYHAPEPQFESRSREAGAGSRPNPPPSHLTDDERERLRTQQEQDDLRLAMAMQAEEERAAGIAHGPATRQTQSMQPRPQSQPQVDWRVPNDPRVERQQRQQQAPPSGGFGDLFGAASTASDLAEDDAWAQERRMRLSSNADDTRDLREMGVMLNPPPPPAEGEEVTGDGGFTTGAAPGLGATRTAPLSASTVDLFGEDVTPLSAAPSVSAANPFGDPDPDPFGDEGEAGQTLVI